MYLLNNRDNPFLSLVISILDILIFLKPKCSGSLIEIDLKLTTHQPHAYTTGLHFTLSLRQTDIYFKCSLLSKHGAEHLQFSAISITLTEFNNTSGHLLQRNGSDWKSCTNKYLWNSVENITLILTSAYDVCFTKPDQSTVSSRSHNTCTACTKVFSHHV